MQPEREERRAPASRSTRSKMLAAPARPDAHMLCRHAHLAGASRARHVLAMAGSVLMVNARACNHARRAP